jgi:hypothetical protein
MSGGRVLDGLDGCKFSSGLSPYALFCLMGIGVHQMDTLFFKIWVMRVMCVLWYKVCPPPIVPDYSGYN